jgi:streptomycin 6-kinase
MPQDWNQFTSQAKRRMGIIKERTGWERELIINWALSHAILSAWWCIEDNMDAEYSLRCAQIFSKLK